VRPRRLGHLGVVVHDMDLMIDFYCDVVGMELSDRMPYPEDSPWFELSWLRVDNDHHVLSFLLPRKPAHSDPMGTGLHHIAFQMETFEDLKAAYTDVRARDLRLAGPARRGGPGSQVRFYFHDPEENIVELFWGLDQIGWDGNVREFMPIEPIDLDALTRDEFLAWKAVVV
jgi:catechol-2,3-dioxygenase